MTNEQTIDEIMELAFDFSQAVHDDILSEMGTCGDANSHTSSSRGALRHAITAALAAKDAEIERLKAKLAEPAPGEWIEWAGGECPIADDARIDVKCRDGDVLRDCLPSSLYWSHYADGNYWGDIVAYRVLP